MDLYLTSETRFCQGKSELGLNFREFYGDNWDHLVEKCFKDWAVVVFGGTFLRDITRGHTSTDALLRKTIRAALLVHAF